MSDIMILTVLKFVSLGIAFTATIWGMTRNTSFDDVSGRKRLTRAGHVAVALALGSFVVAGTSQGFETLAKQAERRNAALDKAARAAEQEVRDARAFRTELAAQQTLNATQLARAEADKVSAEERAARAEGRVFSLRVAEQQRARDMALSQEVNSGSKANLLQAGRVLSQTQRLLLPIEDLSLRITWELPLGGSMPELAALARNIGYPNPLPQGVLTVEATGGITRLIDFDSSFSAYPTFEKAPDVYSAIYSAIGDFGFFAGPIPAVDNSLDPDVAILADWRSRLVTGASPRLTYLVRSDTLVFETAMARGTEITTTGAIVSVLDLDRASLVFSISSARQVSREINQSRYSRLNQALRPIGLILTVSGRTYEARREDFRRLNRYSFTATFRQTSMTPERRQSILDWAPPR